MLPKRWMGYSPSLACSRWSLCISVGDSWHFPTNIVDWSFSITSLSLLEELLSDIAHIDFWVTVYELLNQVKLCTAFVKIIQFIGQFFLREDSQFYHEFDMIETLIEQRILWFGSLEDEPGKWTAKWKFFYLIRSPLGYFTIRVLKFSEVTISGTHRTSEVVLGHPNSSKSSQFVLGYNRV